MAQIHKSDNVKSRRNFLLTKKISSIRNLKVTDAVSEYLHLWKVHQVQQTRQTSGIIWLHIWKIHVFILICYL
jgi:hypothetical protein